ncbi:hypothetical protein WS86_26420 [Burkholderia savannae]|uniref:Uncharacterized protein n=1 Tax=Burkholderia savannae TaxID=1637837 RepID=A0ABR5T3Z6_9BURK|nr:hypothetical protein WS86_26420 [Burkholderia savannae]KWZ37941.1 hypothetical protein WS72_23780 [Burkholderia savannae]
MSTQCIARAVSTDAGTRETGMPLQSPERRARRELRSIAARHERRRGATLHVVEFEARMRRGARSASPGIRDSGFEAR